MWWIFLGSREDKIFHDIPYVKTFQRLREIIEDLGSETNCEVSAKDRTGDSGFTIRFHTSLKLVCKIYIATVAAETCKNTLNNAWTLDKPLLGHSFSFNNW